MKQYFTVKRYASGEYIFREGDEADAIFVIHTGKVEIRMHKNGELITIATIGKGEVFGDMALIAKRNRTADVIALEDTECFRMGVEDFNTRLDALDPLMRTVYKNLSARLYHANELVVEKIAAPCV